MKGVTFSRSELNRSPYFLNDRGTGYQSMALSILLGSKFSIRVWVSMIYEWAA